MIKTIHITVDIFENEQHLNEKDLELVQSSKEICKKAYAPYSNFNVGAAIRLNNGLIVTGNNQENAAYPSGLCAERVAIYYLGSQYPNAIIESIAISCHSNEFEIDKPLTPCGACRQAIAEFENKQNQSISVLMTGSTGEVYKVKSIQDLLPLMFTSENLG